MPSEILYNILFIYNFIIIITYSKHVILNGSLERVQFNNESSSLRLDEQQKVNSPQIVEVIHGKVNSVIHEVRASVDDNIAPLLNLNDENLVKTDETVIKQFNENDNLLMDMKKLNIDFEPSITATLVEQDHVQTDFMVNLSTSETLIKLNDSIVSNETVESLPEISRPYPPSGPVNDTILMSADQPQQHDDIPSFSEWAKKQMAEVEKNKGENLTAGTTKFRFKNYASPDCGAKVVAWNPEALSPGAILSPSRDDYMLNACYVKIWFVVELCEAIRPQRIEIGNFELFSSSPKEFSVYVSDRYQSRDWTLVSSITAKDERNVQRFTLPYISQFVKFIKFELHSHYGTEHYCPISLFKAFGTSELEVLDNDNVDSHVDGDDDDDDDETIHKPSQPSIEEPYDDDDDNDLIVQAQSPHPPPPPQPSTSTMTVDQNGEQLERSSVVAPPPDGGGNLLGTAKAAVMSIVKKAAEVLVVKSGGGEDVNARYNDVDVDRDVTHDKSKIVGCRSPAYLLVCTNCTDEFYNRLYDHISCRVDDLKTILKHSFIYKTLLNTSTEICPKIGLNLAPLGSKTSQKTTSPTSAMKTLDRTTAPAVHYLRAIFKAEMLAAMCNYLAITEKKVLLNTSQNLYNNNYSNGIDMFKSVQYEQHNLKDENQPVIGQENSNDQKLTEEALNDSNTSSTKLENSININGELNTESNFNSVSTSKSPDTEVVKQNLSDNSMITASLSSPSSSTLEENLLKANTTSDVTLASTVNEQHQSSSNLITSSATTTTSSSISMTSSAPTTASSSLVTSSSDNNNNDNLKSNETFIQSTSTVLPSSTIDVVNVSTISADSDPATGLKIQPSVTLKDNLIPPQEDTVDLNSLFSELDDEQTTSTSTSTITTTSSTPTPTTTTTTTSATNNNKIQSSVSNNQASTTSTQKESVFVRLANRIKALEMNMSLSGQYLEELSRRYKKQVEELQRNLAAMSEERRQATERVNLLVAQIAMLTQKVDTLSTTLTELTADKDKIWIVGQHGLIITLEIVVLLIVLSICRWIGSYSNSRKTGQKMLTNKTDVKLRRYSVDIVDGAGTAAKLHKKVIRRLSEQAALPAGTNQLLVSEMKRKTSKDGARKKKKRKKDKLINSNNLNDDDDVGGGVGGGVRETLMVGSRSTTTTNNLQPSAFLVTDQQQQQMSSTNNCDYQMKTAMWSRAKRNSIHTQTTTTTSLESSLKMADATLSSDNNANNCNYSTTTLASSLTSASGGSVDSAAVASSSTAVGQLAPPSSATSTAKINKIKKPNTGTIKKIVKKFF